MNRTEKKKHKQKFYEGSKEFGAYSEHKRCFSFSMYSKSQHSVFGVFCLFSLFSLVFCLEVFFGGYLGGKLVGQLNSSLKEELESFLLLPVSEPRFGWVLVDQFHDQRKPPSGGKAAQDLLVPSTQISTAAWVCSPLIGQRIPRFCSRLSVAYLTLCIAESFVVKKCPFCFLI